MDIPKPPEELRNIIDKLAQFVARNGPDFEQMTKNKQLGNPKFMFLFGGEYHAYYRFRVVTEQQQVFQQQQQQSKMPLPPLPILGGGGGPMGNNFFPSHPSLPPPPPLPFPSVSQAPPTQFSNNQFVPQQQSPLPHHHHHHPHQLPHPHPLAHHHQLGPHLPPPSSLHPPFLPEESFHHNHHHQFQQMPPKTVPNWQPPSPATNPIIQSPIADIESQNRIDSQIQQINDHLKESEKNLNAQKQVIMGVEMERRINEIITKQLDDELKRMCEDFNINLNEFDKILQPIIESCRKESIANGKIWIFNHCSTSDQYDAVAKHLLKRLTRTDSEFEGKLHLMYLINDIFNHCMRKNDDKLKMAIINIIVPAFTTVLMEANDERKQKMNKLLKIWEQNQYIDQTLLDQLKTPEQSLDAYKISLREKYSEQIDMINQEQMNKYKQIEKQHSDFVVHCQNQIQQLQSQKQTLQANMSPLRPSFPSGQINELSPLGPRVPHPHRPVLPMISTPNGTQPPPPPLQPPSSIPFVGPSSVVNNFVQANPSPMPPFPAPFPNQPNFYPTNNVQMYPPLPPYASAMLPSTQMLPDIPSSEHAEPAPYFERPAGLMTTVIKLEDFDYNPIDPKEIKLPALEPPSERLLQALEAFYSPPTHEHPRNAEGWEKLGLYEFFKAKSQARKEYEINVLGQEPTQKDGDDDDDDDDQPFINDSDTSNMAANNNNDEQQKSFREKSPSPPKKSYKEFTEEKSKNRSRSPSDKHRSKKRSRSRSRSPSKSKNHRRESSPKHSRFSKSKSPEYSKFNDSHKKDSDKSTKKMTWSNNTGFTIKESKPKVISSPVIQQSEQYRGFGDTTSSSSSQNTSGKMFDPFESFRRNKGQAYIQRIRDARRD
uniref:Calcium homeostasis endoplasmic reticulum protein-like isoform X2 n=1 Tax=Dermatophagoides pteronyssinus TaxID=6956 RepID=A0A6P6YKL9_DERPT|nr:calcium homeostasis endoplasmic reticulum protein-like isoform X2 [Dermatophagoides pteronyssinus]